MALPASAKEVMTLLNGEEIEVEIVTLGTNDISYKKASNPDGPTYTPPATRYSSFSTRMAPKKSSLRSTPVQPQPNPQRSGNLSIPARLK